MPTPEELTHGVTPDPFQAEAIRKIMEGQSVVVCAPTGSGKTLIAEAAADLALQRGERLFYTTPLKALSNQKFRDMGELFGAERCGLLTGDLSIRPGAPLVVMTTEVFRNMLIRPDRDERIANLRFAVLDECHYIGKTGRGTVWEEAILSCPASIQLIALSATIANPIEVAGWMDAVHPPTALVIHTQRPVPLRVFYCRSGALQPLATGDDRGGYRGRPRCGAAHHRPWEERDSPSDVVEALANKDLLPAIYFTFSRRGCEAALLDSAWLDLMTLRESRTAAAQIKLLTHEYPAVQSYPYRELLARGLAIHHAGMLPAWKAVVERLFQQKLIKVVFATETLSAGVNMPARTTVIASLRRPGERGFRALTPTEFHQMSGRAGRRGMDRFGYAVILAEPQVASEAAATLASSSPEPLESCLSPGYGLVLNWLERYGAARARRMIESGLAMYTGFAGLGVFDSERRAADTSRFASEGLPAADIEASETRKQGRFCAAWKRFEAARAVLDQYSLLEGDRAVGLGLLAAAIQAENELLVAQLLDQAVPEDPDPRLMAALCGAISGASRRAGNPLNPQPSWRLPPPLRALLRASMVVADRLRKTQHEFRFVCPTTLSTEFALLAWEWAGGAAWAALLDATEMDEGDIAYTFRNSLDLLNQIARAPVPPDLSRAAAEARAAIDRPPVNEVI